MIDYCRSKVSTTMPDRFWVDNFGECPIRRSPMCELLVSLKTEDSPASSSLCKFCAAADINMSMDFMGAGGDFDPDLVGYIAFYTDHGGIGCENSPYMFRQVIHG